MSLNIFLFYLGSKSVCCESLGLHRLPGAVSSHVHGHHTCCESGVRAAWRPLAESGNGFGGSEERHKIQPRCVTVPLICKVFTIEGPQIPLLSIIREKYWVIMLCLV